MSTDKRSKVARLYRFRSFHIVTQTVPSLFVPVVSRYFSSSFQYNIDGEIVADFSRHVSYKCSETIRSDVIALRKFNVQYYSNVRSEGVKFDTPHDAIIIIFQCSSKYVLRVAILRYADNDRIIAVLMSLNCISYL